MSNHLLDIYPLEIPDAACPGYFVMSTAPINVEDHLEGVVQSDPDRYIQDIVKHLKKHGNNAEVLVLIHGYNTDWKGAQTWYITACEYLRDKYRNHIPEGLVVIGYRWPSEKFDHDESGNLVNKIIATFNAIPLLMGLCFAVSIGISLLSLLLASLKFLLLITIPIILFIATLIVLRLTVYFRDTWRANNYGVPDLVELVRQLDRAALETVNPSNSEAAAYWKDNRIRLSFIGHSMGAFVVTNTVRILSDVFDQESIGSLDVNQQNKCPSPDIGNVFRLSKLVLVAPDIPVDTIISGRGNTLRSSLRRFEEAYLFANQDDVVLKLASTIANYFSFPAKTREGGYRLGNVFVSGKKLANKLGRRYKIAFGIINLEILRSVDPSHSDYLDYLFISRNIPLARRQDSVSIGGRSIAELFTYFDCTNYTEIHKKTGKEIGIVSYAWDKSINHFGDYFSRFFSTKNLDTHGGYIYNEQADLSKRLIYGLACLGFKGCLGVLHPEQVSSTATVAQVETLSQMCRERGIQVLLASERYKVDVLGDGRNRDGY